MVGDSESEKLEEQIREDELTDYWNEYFETPLSEEEIVEPYWIEDEWWNGDSGDGR